MGHTDWSLDEINARIPSVVKRAESLAGSWMVVGLLPWAVVFATSIIALKGFGVDSKDDELVGPAGPTFIHGNQVAIVIAVSFRIQCMFLCTRSDMNRWQ
jgi:hypothetical protein